MRSPNAIRHSASLQKQKICGKQCRKPLWKKSYLGAAERARTARIASPIAATPATVNATQRGTTCPQFIAKYTAATKIPGAITM